jgi:hypothetical protein
MTKYNYKALEANYRPFNTSSVVTQKPQQPKKNSGIGGILTSLISEGGAIGGGVQGAAVGSVAGPIGTLLGGAIGAGLGGFGGRLIENKVRDNEFRVGDAAKEGAVSALFGASPIRAGKGIIAASKAAAGGAEKTLVREAAEKAILKPGVVGRMLGKGKDVAEEVGGKLTDKATTSFLKLTPAQTKTMLDNGVDPQKLAKIASRYGASAEDIIGRTGSGGPLQSTIKGLEDGIEKTASTAGNNVRILGDDLVKALKDERKIISRRLGGGSQLNAIDLIIADAEKKYAKGVTVKQARNILKEANQKFGASILDDAGNAVARDAQKLEGNIMRKVLKDRFPGIKQALDDESELIQLREILKGTRAKNITGGFKTGKLDITRPGSFFDAVLNSKKVSRGILSQADDDVAKEFTEALALKPPSVPGQGYPGVASRILASPDITSTGFDPDQEQPVEDSSSIGSYIPDSQEEPSDDPYSSENIQSSVEKILQQGGDMKDVKEYLNTAKLMQELTGGGKPIKKTEGQRARDEASQLTDIALEQLAGGSIDTGIIGSKLQGVKEFFGQGDQETLDFNTTISSLRAAIAKARAGTSFTPNEEALLNKYAPKAGDTGQQLRTKLSALKTVYDQAAQREYGVEYQPELTLQGAQ